MAVISDLLKRFLFNSDGSGPEFFGFGLKSGLSFRVYRVSFAKNASGLNGFGFNPKISFRVRV